MDVKLLILNHSNLHIFYTASKTTHHRPPCIFRCQSKERRTWGYGFRSSQNKHTPSTNKSRTPKLKITSVSITPSDLYLTSNWLKLEYLASECLGRNVISGASSGYSAIRRSTNRGNGVNFSSFSGL